MEVEALGTPRWGRRAPVDLQGLTTCGSNSVVGILSLNAHEHAVY